MQHPIYKPQDVGFRYMLSFLREEESLTFFQKNPAKIHPINLREGYVSFLREEEYVTFFQQKKSTQKKLRKLGCRKNSRHELVPSGPMKSEVK